MPSSAILSFTDPYAYQTAVRAADVEIVVTGRGDYRAELTRIDLHHLWMQRRWQSLPYIAHTTTHKNRSPIFFPTDPRQLPLRFSGMEVSPGDIVLVSSGAELYNHAPAGCHWGVMSLTPDHLAAAGRALVGRDLSAPAVTHPIRPSPPLVRRLLNLHKAAADLAATAPDMLAHPEVAKAIEQALVNAMIACLTDPAAVQRGSSSHQRLAVMRRFEQLLQANKEQPLYMAEVCAQLRVSDRTLRSQCKEHLGMGPHRYLWLRRMHLARRALALADGTSTTVTDIAMDHGFAELGRFAVSYRKLFGETPSVTLRRPPDHRLFSGIPISEFPALRRSTRAVPAIPLLQRHQPASEPSRRATLQ
jgi:AraC-like DNA-binding protein